MTDNKCFVFRFDDVEVRDREFVLTKGGEVLPIEPKAFRVLQYLLRNPNKLVTKDELLNAVWSDVSVSENSVARAVAQLRRLLGDDLREPRYIATVPTVGYRFVCNLEVLEDVSCNGKVTDSANVPGVSDPVRSASRPEEAKVAAPAEPRPVPTATPERAGSSNDAWTRILRFRSGPLRIAFAACACCVLLAGFGIYVLKPPPPRTKAFRFWPSGIDVGSPMWSPDGKAIVYTDKPKEGATRQLFLRYLNSPVGIQLTHLPPDQTDVLPLGWSNDRSHIIFHLFESGHSRIYSIPTVGGIPEFVMVNPFMELCCVALSPDGKALVSFGKDGLGTFRLYISDPLGTEPRPYLPDLFATRSFTNQPALKFSPDGKKLLFIVDGGDMRQSMWLLPFPEGGKPPRRLPVALPEFNGTPNFDWMPDSRHIVVSMATAADLPAHLWMADTESADFMRLTGGAESNRDPLVAPDGKSVIYAQVVPKFSVVSVSVLDGATRATIETGREEAMPSWSAKTGKLVWVSNRNGPYEIWLREADGSERPVVTAADFPPGMNKWFFSPAISSDGERIIYARVDASGVMRLWISSLAGGPPLRLTNVEPDKEYPGSCSPDGSRFVYVQEKGGKTSLMMVKTSGNAAPEALKDLSGFPAIPDWSRGGDWITFRDDNGWHLISPDGKTSKSLGKIGSSTDFLAFSKDGKLLYGVRWGEAGSDPDQWRGVLFSLDPVTLRQKVIKDLGRSFEPFAGVPQRFTFAPDGQSFLFTIDQSRLDWTILEGLPQPGWRDRLRSFFGTNSKPEVAGADQPL